MDSANALQTIMTAIPADVRKGIYKTAKLVAAFVTLGLLILPGFESVSGLSFPDSDRYVAIATGLLALLAHLADSNTITEPLVDVNPAPETGNPIPPEGVVDPGYADLEKDASVETPEVPKETPPGDKDPSADVVTSVPTQ